MLRSALAWAASTRNHRPWLISPFSDPVEIAAAYLFYLCRNHPFVDGNKRTALATCLVVLDENDLLQQETLDPKGWEALTLDVAASRADREQTTKRLRQLLPQPQVSTPTFSALRILRH
jgi:prophage maintenance system killer protein